MASSINDHSELKAKLLQLAQLSGFHIDANILIKGVEDGTLTDADFYHTFIRLWQVFSNCIANNKNSDSTNPNSSYEQVMNNSVFLPYFLTAFTLIPALIGAYYTYKDMKEAREKNTTAYQMEQIRKINPETTIVSEKRLLNTYNDFLARKKVQFRPRTDRAQEPVPESIPSKIFGMVSFVWTKIQTASIIFWPIWMIGMLTLGMIAANIAPALPIIAGITAIISATYFGAQAYFYYKEKKLKSALPPKTADESAQEAYEIAELKRMREEEKIRAHAKEERTYVKNIFHIAPKQKPAKEKITPAYIVKATHDEKVIHFAKNPDVAHQINGEASVIDAAKKKALYQSKLYQKLVGDESAKKRLLFLNVLFTAIGNYTLSAFGLWLLSTVAAAVSMVTAGAVAAFFAVAASIIGSGWMTFGLGIVVGAFTATNVYKQTKADQIDKQNKGDALLLEAACEHVPGVMNPTKMEAFEYFYNNVENKKNALLLKLQAAQFALKQCVLKEGIASLSVADKFILELDVKKMDIHNSHYFENQKPMSLMQKARAFTHRVFRMLYTAQTAVFVVRSTFLIGGVVAMALILNPYVFIAIALSTALVIGVARGIQLYEKNKADKNADIIDKVEAYTSTLKKYEKTLDDVQEYLAHPFADSKIPSDLSHTATVTQKLQLMKDTVEKKVSELPSTEEVVSQAKSKLTEISNRASVNANKFFGVGEMKNECTIDKKTVQSATFQ